MTPIEAKRFLLAYRPGTSDADDAQVAEALAESRRDPRLQEWAIQNAVFQQGMRRTLRGMPVPADLRERILARNKVLTLPWWQRPYLLAAAAAIALLLGVGWMLLQSAASRPFETFRDRMVRAVLRQYTMDIVTNDMAEVRKFLSARNAPSDYALPAGLAKLPVSGAGVLSWQDRRVTMVCLDSPNQGTLFLFVVDRSSVAGAPGVAQEFDQVSRLMTVSWSEGDRTYVLAGNGSRETLQDYWR
jgi:anti-sigma factor RsiW